jgi:phosphoribosylanthranilate isomerase
LSKVRVKICGIRKEEDVHTAVEAGADCLGFVVGVPSSPRNLSVETARKLMKKVPDPVRKVVVTVKTEPDIEEMLSFLLSALAPDVIQLHGQELSIPRSIRQSFAEVEFIGALAIRDESSLADGLAMSRIFDGIHADSHADGLSGGTGNTHNWKLSARVRDLIDPTPLTLAGGLSQDNVAEAIRVVRPFAVDVSTGVESSLGVKDHDKIFEFVRRAKQVSLS